MNPEEQQPQPQTQPQPTQSTRPQQPGPMSVNNPLAVMQQGESVICEIRRHPFGLFGIYFGSACIIALLLGVVAILPQFMDVTSQLKMAAFVAFLIALAVVVLFTYAATTVYKGNRWVVTSDSLTQITQVSLFGKQSSQLSLANLEDVTAAQNGILQSMLNFGTLRAETAGERSKFVFRYCPNPNYYARQILQAREQFEQMRDERGGTNVNTEEL